MEQLDRDEALKALAWQIELGADEAILDTPVDRYALKPEAPPAPRPAPAGPSAPAAQEPSPEATEAFDLDPVAVARKLASEAQDLAALQAALAAYPHCELRNGAKNLVFSDGQPGARVMIIGEAPGRDEDTAGKPFVGRAGQLLDRMLQAIGLHRAHADPEHAAYITNIIPWRPPQNRDPKPAEIAMMMPFVERHVALAEPQAIVLMGNIACQGVLGRRGITRMRGTWDEAFGKPVLPMFHPAYLLRNPSAKRHAWEDLLSLKARL